MKLKCCLLPAVLFCVSFGAVGSGAEEMRLVSGIVKDPSGAVVPGAVVALLNAAQTVLGTAKTDTEGRFSLTRVPSGSYILTIKSAGFAEMRLAVQARLPGEAELSITTRIQPPQDFVTITANLGTVTGSSSVAQPVNVIDREALSQRTYAALAQAANEEVGLYLQRTSPTIGAIFVRGLTGNKVNVFVDGIRYSNAAMRGGINTFFDMTQAATLEAVEVLRGPNSAQYGSDAIGGSVQLLSRLPAFSTTDHAELRGEWSGYFNSADSSAGSSLSSSFAGRRFSLLLDLSGRRVNRMRPGGGIDSHSAFTRFFGLRSDRFEDGRMPDTAFTQYGGSVKVNWTPDAGSQVIAYYARNQQDAGKRFDQLLGGDGNFVADLRNLMADISYLKFNRHRLGWFDQVTAVFSYNSQREERVNQGGNGNIFAAINHQYERTAAYGAQIHVDRRWAPGQFLALGGDYYHERITAPAFDDNPVTRTIVRRRPRIPDNAGYDHGGVYLQNIFDVVRNRLQLIGNLRFSAASYEARAGDSPLVQGKSLWPDDQMRASSFTFRFGAVAGLSDTLSIFGNISRGFRAPHMTDLGTLGLTGSGFEVSAPDVAGMNATVGTSAGDSAQSSRLPVEQVRPETSMNYEAGARFRNGWLSSSLAVFQNRIGDGIAKQALILPQGAVGLFLGGERITSQNGNGVVWVGVSSSPVLVRTNYDTARIMGLEHTLDLRIKDRLSISTLYTRLNSKDMRTGLPPNIEGGTPPNEGYLKLRVFTRGGKAWIEPYLHASARQDRLSSLDLEDRRTGAMRSRSNIKNFFLNGATYRGLVGPGPDGKFGGADDTLLATGETLALIQDRVLGAGVSSAPLFRAIPGFVTFNVRFGVRFMERNRIMFDLQNLGDRNYRGPSWGIDAPGRSIAVSYQRSL